MQVDGKTYAVVVSSGRFALLDTDESDGREQLVDAFGRSLGRDARLMRDAEMFFGTALRTVDGEEGSYLGVEQGERAEFCARCEVVGNIVWIAARKVGDSVFLWLDLADAGV